MCVFDFAKIANAYTPGDTHAACDLAPSHDGQACALVAACLPAAETPSCARCTQSDANKTTAWCDSCVCWLSGFFNV